MTRKCILNFNVNQQIPTNLSLECKCGTKATMLLILNVKVFHRSAVRASGPSWRIRWLEDMT